MMFWSSGVAPGASRPMLAVIRPHSSKLAEFISSWMPLRWKGIDSCGPARVSNVELVAALLVDPGESVALRGVASGCCTSRWPRSSMP